MNKLDKENLRQLLSNKFGAGPKFLATYLLEVERLSGLSVINGYQERLNDFQNLVKEYKAHLSSNSSRYSQIFPTESSENNEVDKKSSIKKSKQTYDAALVEKFRTPIGIKTKSVFNFNKPVIDLISEDEQNKEQNFKARKRSAAEISVLVDDNSCGEDNENEEEVVKKSLFKSDVDAKKNTKLKSVKKKGDKKQNEEVDEEDNQLETSVTSSKDSEKVEKKGKNPSKKIKVAESTNDDIGAKKKVKQDEVAIEETETDVDDAKNSKKATTKKKKTTKNSDHEDLEVKESEAKKSVKKGKKIKKSKLTNDFEGNEENGKKTEKVLPKTPVAKDQQNRKSRLEMLQSTLKKTVKKRPLTRRAAAQAAAAAVVDTASNKPPASSSGLKAPGTIKKINKFEFGASKQGQVIASETSKTPMAHRNKVINNLILTSSKIKPNFRTSIDERKARNSHAKLEAKRKSVKKAQAILKSIQSERKLSHTTTVNIITDDEEEVVKIRPSIGSSEKEKEIIANILKSGSPKLVIHKIPSLFMTSNNAISATKATAYIESQRRLTKDLLTSNTIQQNFRVLQPQLLSKMTPSKPPIASTNQNRVSYIKFMERNTPSKLTRTEQEEKQKIELQLKEAKERERLQTIEKQKQEKLDEKKKKREEKMRKINELKAKQQQELEKKQKEAQQAQQESKSKLPTTSNSCMNLNQLKNQNASTALSASTTNLSTVKKPLSTIQNTKAICEQSDLSTFSNEFHNFKQINDQLKQGPLAFSTGSENHNAYKEKNLCETTYVLNSPSNNKVSAAFSKKAVFTNYEVTPLQPPKLKNKDNYDVSDLKSEDDTDDDEDPSKPIPDWAREPHLHEKVTRQCKSMFNFTKVFKAACQSEIILEDIFKTRRKKFTERSSSANWDSTPLWKSNGISGEESFWQFKKHY